MSKNEKENNYRAERKNRLAKAAKKKNKNHDSVKTVTVILIVVLVAALLAGIGGGLYAYGVPQKILPAVKVGDRTYSIAEYSFYYTSVYQTYANQSYSTQQTYGISLGFDYQKDPAAQTTTDEDGNEITYDQFFRNYVIETLEAYNHYLAIIKEKGITLSEESAAEIDSAISEIEGYASNYGYSADRYISVLFGKGLNLKKYRSLLEEQYLVSQYVSDITDKLAKDITMDEILAAYEENPADYEQVDLRLFGFTLEESETEEVEAAELTEDNETDSADAVDAETDAESDAAEETEATPSLQEQLAQEMLDQITDEASFVELAKEYCAESDKELFEDDTATLAVGITKETVKSNIDEELAEWLFDEEREVGDKTIAVTDSYVYVIMIKNTAYRNETPLVNARHILISYDSVESMLAEEAAENEAATEDETTDETTDETAETVDNTDDAAQTDENAVLTASDGKEITAADGYSAQTVLEAYEEALSVLEKYKSGENTEEAFAALAEEYSADTASIGDNGEGGLYEGIAKGQMVKAFEDWVYDETRQPGDVDIIQTTYGWHVMYFVSRDEEAPWIKTIRSSISSEKQETMEDELKQEVSGTAVTTSFTNFAAKEALKLINKLYVNNNADSNA